MASDTLIFLLQSFLINLKKSVLSPVQKFGNPKPRIRISTNDSNLTGNKSEEIDFKVKNLNCQPQSKTFGCNQSDRFSLPKAQVLKFNAFCQCTMSIKTLSWTYDGG